MSHLQGWSAHASNLIMPVDSPQFISPAMWSDVLHPEVLHQCDALDGVSEVELFSALVLTKWLQLNDGIISQPFACK